MELLKDIRTKAVLTDAYVAGTLIEDVKLFSELVILADFVVGSLTNAEIKVEYAAELYYDLAYDGQSANFTVGQTLTGAQSGAKGLIIADTDGGTTGTLTLQKLNNIDFIDNEIITDDNTSPGSATVNGTASVSSFTFYHETSTVEDLTNNDVKEVANTKKMTADGKYLFTAPVYGNYIRISAKGTGTVTNSLLGIKAILNK
ncbi:MAG: hypothetical protein V1779_17690 [bacterium]